MQYINRLFAKQTTEFEWIAPINPREAFQEMYINTFLPGASPEEVELTFLEAAESISSKFHPDPIEPSCAVRLT